MKSVSNLYRRALKLIPRYIQQQQVKDFLKILILKDLRLRCDSNSQPADVGEREAHRLMLTVDSDEYFLESFCKKHVRDMFSRPLPSENSKNLRQEYLESGYLQIERVERLILKQKCNQLFDACKSEKLSSKSHRKMYPFIMASSSNPTPPPSL
eukprot:Sdes_comp23649_c0_seq1m21833